MWAVQERITFLKWVEKNPIVTLKERPESFIETKIALGVKSFDLSESNHSEEPKNDV